MYIERNFTYVPLCLKQAAQLGMQAGLTVERLSLCPSTDLVVHVSKDHFYSCIQSTDVCDAFVEKLCQTIFLTFKGVRSEMHPCAGALLFMELSRVPPPS